MKKVAVLSFLCLATAVVATQGQVSQPPFKWFTAGAGLVLPRELTFENASGRLGILNADGPVATKGHPFFEALGSERQGLRHVSPACQCHEPLGRSHPGAVACDKRQRPAVCRDRWFGQPQRCLRIERRLIPYC